MWLLPGPHIQNVYQHFVGVRKNCPRYQRQPHQFSWRDLLIPQTTCRFCISSQDLHFPTQLCKLSNCLKQLSQRQMSYWYSYSVIIAIQVRDRKLWICSSLLQSDFTDGWKIGTGCPWLGWHLLIGSGGAEAMAAANLSRSLRKQVTGNLQSKTHYLAFSFILWIFYSDSLLSFCIFSGLNGSRVRCL